MAVTCTIDGTNRVNNILLNSYEVIDSIPARSDTLTFQMVISSAEIAGDATIVPRGGNEVIWTVDGTLEFGGEVTEIEETYLINPDAYRYQVTCNDYTRRLDRLLAVYQEIGGEPLELDPQLSGGIIKTVLTDFAPEFATDLTQIADGVVVAEQQYDYTAISAILDQLASMSGYVWWIDFSKVVHFQPAASFTSPLTGGTYDVDADTDLGDFNWREDISQIKNRVYLRDSSTPDSEESEDSFVSDGVASFHKLFQEPKDVESTSVNSIKPDGTETEWNIEPDPLTTVQGTLKGPAGTAYLCILNWGIRFPLDDEGVVRLETNEVVEIVTTPMRDDIVYVVEDIDSQKMMADREGLTWGVNAAGIYEHVISLGDVRLPSPEAAEQYGDLLLQRSAWPEVTGTFITQVLGGWKAGQYFTLSSSKRDLYDAETYWKDAVKVDIGVWAQTVTKRVLGPDRGSGTVIMETIVEFANVAIPG